MNIILFPSFYLPFFSRFLLLLHVLQTISVVIYVLKVIFFITFFRLVPSVFTKAHSVKSSGYKARLKLCEPFQFCVQLFYYNLYITGYHPVQLYTVCTRQAYSLTWICEANYCSRTTSSHT